MNTTESTPLADAVDSLDVRAGGPTQVDTPEGRSVSQAALFDQDMNRVDGRSMPTAIAARQQGRLDAREGKPLCESAAMNAQKYINSVLPDNQVATDYAGHPDALFNSADPNLAIIHEKPEHRAMVYMKSKMLSNTEIAKRTGYSMAWVSQITRQPWFKLQLIKELKDAGSDGLREMFQASALDSIFTLIEVRDTDTAPANARIAASNSILDRVLGKPVQHVETKNQTIPTSDEISKLNKDIAESEAALQQLSKNGNQS